MTPNEAIWLYMFVAVIQAIFVARLMKEKTAPGLLVIVLTIMAPLVSLGIIFELVSRTVKLLVTYKND